MEASSSRALPEAELTYGRILAEQPGLVRAWNRLGTVWHTMGPIDEGINAYRRAIALGLTYAQAGIEAAFRGMWERWVRKVARDVRPTLAALAADFRGRGNHQCLRGRNPRLLRATYEPGVSALGDRQNLGSECLQVGILSRPRIRSETGPQPPRDPRPSAT